MDATTIALVAATVTALTQIVKWAGLPDRWGPLAVIALAFVGVAVWAYSRGNPATFRYDLFDYFSGWITVALTAAGIFGFTRAAASTVTQIKAPPGGAGQNPTLNE
jgi:hypothetical protein